MNQKKIKRLRRAVRHWVDGNWKRMEVGAPELPLTEFSHYSKEDKERIAKEIAKYAVKKGLEMENHAVRASDKDCT